MSQLKTGKLTHVSLREGFTNVSLVKIPRTPVDDRAVLWELSAPDDSLAIKAMLDIDLGLAIQVNDLRGDEYVTAPLSRAKYGEDWFPFFVTIQDVPGGLSVDFGLLASAVVIREVLPAYVTDRVAFRQSIGSNWDHSIQSNYSWVLGIGLGGRLTNENEALIARYIACHYGIHFPDVCGLQGS